MGFFGCLLTVLFLAMSAYSPRAEARESRFFSKVSRTEPERASPKAEAPLASPSKEEASEQGYGLYGKEETYQYSPTTKNPTKSEPGKFRYVQPNGWSGRQYTGERQGRSYETGEKQGMSDTRFLENGRYFYDIDKENEFNGGKLTENDDGHESYYGYRSGSHSSQYTGERQGRSSVTGEKQGMSDTRFLENGRYFYDIEAEEKRNNGYTNNEEFYSNSKYDNANEEENEEELRGTEEKQGKTGEKQGRTNEARFGYKSDQYDEGVDTYKNEKANEYSEKEKAEFDGKFGKGYDFRSTPNKFPNHEFDSIEEYEKYEQGRSHIKQYDP